MNASDQQISCSVEYFYPIAWFAFCRILMAISLAPLALLPFVLGKFRRRLTDRGDTRQISKSNGPTEPEGGVP